MTENNQGKKGGLRKWLGLGGTLDDETTQESSHDTQERFSYQLREAFLSEAEIYFYRVLKKMVSERLVIFTKVSQTDVFSISGSDVSKDSDMKNQKTVDFLLCDPDSFKPVLALFFEDNKNLDVDQINKEESLDEVFASAGLPFVKVNAMDSYDIPELARAFRKAIENVSVSEEAIS